MRANRAIRDPRPPGAICQLSIVSPEFRQLRRDLKRDMECGMKRGMKCDMRRDLERGLDASHIRSREQPELAAKRAMAPCLVPPVMQKIQLLKSAVAPAWCHFGATAHPVVPPKTMCRQQDGRNVAPSLLSC